MATALTTLANVKDWLQLSGNASDGTLSRMIVAFSAAAANNINRDLGLQSYTEARNGNGGSALAFAAYPVTAVVSLTIDGVTVPAQVAPGGPGYVFSPTVLTLIGYAFTRGAQNVRLLTTAGFAQIPPELEQAVIEWIADRFAERDRIGVNSKSLSGENVSFAHAAIPDSVLAQLLQFRKVVPN